MWCLSGGLFIAAMSVFFRGKKVELPLVAISTAMLFALPNVRNSQPGIPAVAGTTSDSECTFCLIMSAIDANALLSSDRLLLESVACSHQVCFMSSTAELFLSDSLHFIVVPFRSSSIM